MALRFQHNKLIVNLQVHYPGVPGIDSVDL